MENITTILFDVDGTLLDTKELIFRAFEKTFDTHKKYIPPRGEFTKVVGKPLVLCYQILTGEKDVSMYTKTHHNFQMDNLYMSRPFPNSLQTLQQLKAHSFKIAAVTSRKRDTTQRTLEMAGLTRLIDFSVFADEVVNHKPDPEPLMMALKALSTSPEQALMVGDSDADILGGKNTGTKTAAAIYGFHGERLRDLKPDYILNDISDLLSILRIQ